MIINSETCWNWIINFCTKLQYFLPGDAICFFSLQLQLHLPSQNLSCAQKYMKLKTPKLMIKTQNKRIHVKKHTGMRRESHFSETLPVKPPSQSPLKIMGWLIKHRFFSPLLEVMYMQPIKNNYPYNSRRKQVHVYLFENLHICFTVLLETLAPTCHSKSLLRKIYIFHRASFTQLLPVIGDNQLTLQC